MTSLYGKYIQEKIGDLILETEEGFATYRYINEKTQVYIIDIYVLPEFRKTKLASALADQIVALAKFEGAKELIGTVNPSVKGSTESLKVLLGYGMSLKSASNDLIIFGKEI